MDCPRCAATAIDAPECPRCGVILARARAPRPAATARRPPGTRRRTPRAGVVLLMLLLLAAVLGWFSFGRTPPAAPGADAGSAPVQDDAPTPRDRPSAPAPLPDATSAPPERVLADAPDASALAAAAEARDRELASRLSEALRARSHLQPADLRDAELLYARYPQEARALLAAVLVTAAQQERDGGHATAALPLLERAGHVAPASLAPRRGLLAVRLDLSDWAGAEAAARDVLAIAPADAEAVRSLAHALVRLDRSREAEDLLAGFLQSHPDSRAAALLERIRRDASTERPLEEQRLAHFHVRYDGEAHVDVGREVLRVLERHYATLVLAFDYQPAAPIPVVLLSSESYYDATGAPAWSGGLYDDFDGRVRLPIAGLTTALHPELDATVLHELTHAFVAGRSAGLAPRVIQEGLAQLMEGKRSATVLGEDGLRALADGRIRGVGGFYLEALGFVEDLVARRGQGGINDLLAELARTRDADGAFRQVYGRELAPLQADWRVRLRQRYGS